jgi:predicted DNA-binding protein (UPF0251 family)
MSRPRKPRNCTCPHRAGYAALFKPAGIPLDELEVVKLGHDELESMHLCDGKGMNQIEAGEVMGVSRGTVQRLLASARCKVAQALVQQQGLAVTCMDKCDKVKPCCETTT